MSGATLESGQWVILFLRMLGAAAVTGLAVKLMDDSLDLEIDRSCRRPNLALSLNGAAAAYALACLAIGVSLEPRLALGLFFSAYSLGMGIPGRDRLPSGLPEGVESALGIAIGLWSAGTRMMGIGVLSLAAIQLIDDLADRESDQLVYPKPLINFLGTAGSLLLAAVLVLLSMSLGPRETISVLIAATGLQLYFAWQSNRIGGDRDALD